MRQIRVGIKLHGTDIGALIVRIGFWGFPVIIL